MISFVDNTYLYYSDIFMQKRAFYTTFEISKICGVNPTTVQNWVKSKRLKAFQTPGGHRRVSHNNLMDFLREFSMPIPHGFADENPLMPSPAIPPIILIVDDDADVRNVIEGTLQSENANIRIMKAQSGVDALLTIGKTRPDMIILDIMMPEMNGFQVCERLKASPETQDIIIVGVSGNHEPEVRKRIMEAGADMFFTKPFDLADFRDKCRQLLHI